MIADSCSKEIAVYEGQQMIITRGKMKCYNRDTKKRVWETQRKIIKNEESFSEEASGTCGRSRILV